jgi:hypothetical protein
MKQKVDSFKKQKRPTDPCKPDSNEERKKPN